MVEKSRCPLGRDEVAFWLSRDELRQLLEKGGDTVVQAELLSLDYQGEVLPKKTRLCVKATEANDLGWLLQTVVNLAVTEENLECPNCGWEKFEKNK
jgi:hypothetical protein